MAGQMMTWEQLAKTYHISPGELPRLIEDFKDSGGQAGRFGVSDGEDLPISLFFPLETAPLCKACGRPILPEEDEDLPRWLLELDEEMCATCLSKMPVANLLKEGKLALHILILVYERRLHDVLPFLSLDSATEEMRQVSGQEDAEKKVTQGQWAGTAIVTKHLRPDR